MPVSAGRKVRFGSFQVDLHTGELSNNGNRVRLQPQPLQVLVILLERPGELITREEFRKRLWADDTFVDFEHSLNTDIKKLRQALGDEAETPRYIETLPKRGYRLLAEVSAPETVAPVKDAANPAGNVRSKRRFWSLVVLSLLFVAGFAVLLLYQPRTPYIARSHQLTTTGKHKSPFGLRRVVTDGSRIYFAERHQDRWNIVQVSVIGGEVSTVNTGQIENPRILDISPDGSELLVVGYKFFDSLMWIIPLPAGSPRQVGEIRPNFARFTPDGSRLLYSSGKNLYIANKDGTHIQQLLTAAEEIEHFAVSPDGKRVRFYTGKIFEARMDGSEMHPYLAGREARHCCGEWSPDGRFYVYSEYDEHLANLFAVSEHFFWPQKSPPKPIQLTFGPIPFAFPTVSRDGKQIFVLGETLKGELQIYDEKSGLLEPYLSGISAGSVDFTADGQWVTYVSFPEGRLWRSRADGSDRVQLTFSNFGPIANPKWSPDNRLILFEEWLPKQHKIYVMPASGGNPLLLMTDQMDPNWSPDGKSIVYSSLPYLDAQVQLMNLDDRNSTVVPGSEGLIAPRWSPDGRFLLALSVDLTRLMLYEFRTKKWKMLYVTDEIGFPSFSHDSQYVYLSHGFTQERGEILRIRIADGRAERAADLKSIETTMPILRLGGWFALTPDDRILVLRDRGSDELYALDMEFR